MGHHDAGGLEAHLADTQQSLAVALARVEAYRCRERILLRDYQVLLSRAAVAGIDLSQQSTEIPHEDDGTAAHSPLQQVAASNSGTASAPTHLALCSLTERHPIHIHTSHGRVPGTLLVAGNSLHFVETHARVGPAEYLGLRTLPKAEAAEARRPSRMNSAASLRAMTSGANSPTSSSRGDSSTAGVLSGAANWLAQKVRVPGSGRKDSSGDSTTAADDIGLGFSSIMESIMHTLDDDSSDEAEAPRPEARPLHRKSSSRRSGSASAAAAASASLLPAPSSRSSQHQGRTPYTGPAEQSGQRLWDIAWGDEQGQMRRLQFEGDIPARAFIDAQVQSWAQLPDPQVGEELSIAATAYAAAKPVTACAGCNAAISTARLPMTSLRDGRAIRIRVFGAEDLELAVPDPMRPVELEPDMDSRSGILGPREAQAVAGSLPARHRLCAWKLLYSTDRHGISLQTLYRRAVASPSLLFIKDTKGFVFGAFTSEGWRLGTRFFGTGETFVFQLRPHQVAWKWNHSTARLARNDYFMFGAADSLAVGGGGNFALFLQEDLLGGSSGISATFGNACLASANEFSVTQVELWSLSRT